MRFSHTRETVRRFALVTVSCLLGAVALARQSLPANPNASQSAPPKQVIPRDPKDLLLAAAQVNGLDAPGLKPWHILVSYDEFDKDGDNVDSGTYEEFWIGTSQYRLAYTSHDFTQTDIAIETGLFRSGDEKWPGELQTRVRDEFVRPMFREMNLGDSKLEKETRQFGKVRLPCVFLRSIGNLRASDNGLPGFCFEPDSLMLRYSKGGLGSIRVWDQISYDDIVVFQGRFIARNVHVTQGGKLYLTLHLEKLESIPPSNLTPAPTAIAIDDKLISPDGRVLMLDYLLHQEIPQYPKSIHGGEVVLKYRINKEGRVTAVQFVEGNSEMQDSSEEALKKFVYRPFLLRGTPVEVEVTQKFGYQVH